ncbi:hypothetical protein HLV37_00680 [Eggerthellaceae bacterium zg-1084]|nr:hypothetical protein [Berryella wangjianweii]NPD30405.1 hypothetical protein [Berryella wangjianweii]
MSLGSDSDATTCVAGALVGALGAMRSIPDEWPDDP